MLWLSYPKSGVLATNSLVFVVLLVIAVAGGADAQSRAVWAWGLNNHGQLGDGTTVDRPMPVQVSGLDGVVSLAAGSAHTLALREDGTVWAWGWNEHGQVGDGTTTDRWTPVQTPGLTNVIAIAAGGSHSIALRSDGRVFAWGANPRGQLGDGSTVSRLFPIQVTGLGDVVQVACASETSYAVRDDGNAFAWGANSGLFGDGGTDPRSVPGLVPGLPKIALLGTGSHHVLAAGIDGSLWASGYNEYGQLGDGTTNHRYSFVPVAGAKRLVSIGSGPGYFSLALRSDGSTFGWGMNSYGQLGGGALPDRLQPAMCPTLPRAVVLAVGGYHGLALTPSGEAYGWGHNEYGQVGDGGGPGIRLPGPVQGVPTLASIAGGRLHSVASDTGPPNVSGLIRLGDVAAHAGSLATLRFYKRGADAPYLARLVPLGSNGGFETTVPLSGKLDLVAIGPSHLRSKKVVDIGPGGATGIEFSLFNGDVNGDNSVNVLDFLAWRQAFGSVEGGPAWDPFADLDRTGSVNLADFLVLRRNWGRSGDA